MKKKYWGWLLPACTLLFCSMLAVGQNTINSLEYFVDTDPGFGKAAAVSNITPAAVLNNISVEVDIAGLADGLHNVYFRSGNNNGRWSITSRLLFLKQTVSSPNLVTKLEYYLDNISEPGFGNATNIPITSGSMVQDVALPIDVNSLSIGVHRLLVRSRDEQGRWSMTNRWMFVKDKPVGGDVVKMEYFLDNITDPGFGNATNIPITKGAMVNDVVVPLNIATLSNGIHRLYVRSLDINGHWSLTNRVLFLKDTLGGNLAKAEYFFNTDPGFGNGTNIAITPGATVNDVLLNLNTGSLPTGLNNLYVRSQNANGSWGLTNKWLFWNDGRSGNVTQVEYFYNTDPGFGNGIPVAINATTMLADYLVPVNVTGLTVGQHILYLRTRSERGWSITNKDTFQVTQTVATPLINVNSVTSKVNCAWGAFRISFHATGTYNTGNRFTVQLSDKDGSFASPITIGDTLTTRSSEVYCLLPTHLPDGDNYRIRVVSSNQVVTGISGIDAITIHDRPELGADTTSYIVCQGETYNLVPLYSTAGYTTADWSASNPSAAPAGTYSLIVSNIYGCRDTALATVKQDVAVWTGAVSKNWHTPGNWSTNRIPNEKTHVIIDGAAINSCEMTDNDGAAASVQMRSSGSIKLLNGRKLMIEATCNPLPSGL